MLITIEATRVSSLKMQRKRVASSSIKYVLNWNTPWNGFSCSKYFKYIYVILIEFSWLRMREREREREREKEGKRERDTFFFRYIWIYVNFDPFLSLKLVLYGFFVIELTQQPKNLSKPPISLIYIVNSYIVK